MTRRPDFFIVGAPKCGTSSLYYYLLQHPDIFMPHSDAVSRIAEATLAEGYQAAITAGQLKEPHFFGRDLHFGAGWRTAVTQDEYLALFRDATIEKRIGEASVWYLYSERAAGEIKEFAPDARIIIMLRDPVEVMFRMHGQACFNGTETIRDFESALQEQPHRMAALGRCPDLNPTESLFYRRAVSFTEQVQRYFDQFGRERTHVIIFDDLRADTAKVNSDTLAFLEVDSEFTASLPRANPMSQVRSMRLQRFLAHPPRGLRSAVRAMLPSALRQWLVGLALRANVQYGTRPQLDPALRKRLQQGLAEEVERLSHLLDRDLTHWSRP